MTKEREALTLALEKIALEALENAESAMYLTSKGEEHMTKEEALKIIKLLSALESWAFSTKNPLPSFVDDELIKAMAVLERVVLGRKT